MTNVVEEQHLIEPLKNRFGKIAEKNINAMKRAISETKTEV
jgi:Pyruvate/2-oxoacid:ferredoxin oxidoreductase gamma subunit